MIQKLRRMQKGLHTKKVGWCGLGAMGSVMAPHLLAVTDNLIGYDVNPHVWQTALLNPDLKRAEQLTDLAQTDTLITMLPDGPAVRSVCGAVLSAGFSGTIIDMSSCHPQDSLSLADDITAEGSCFIDAPVSGGVAKATSAELMIMAGGEGDDIRGVQTLLTAMGNLQHVGPVGAGHAMKALNNYVSAAGLLASFQALATAKDAGISPETFIKVINSSTGRNNTTEVKLEKFVLPETFNSGFALQLMAKDVNIARELIEAAGYTTPVTPALAACLDSAVSALGQQADHTALYSYITDEPDAEGLDK